MKKVVVFPCSVYRGRSGSLGPVNRNALVVECRPDVGGIGSCGGVGALLFGAYAYRCAAAIGFDGVCSFQLGDNDVVFGRNRACRRDDGETGTGDDSAKCCNVHGRGYWLVMANLSYIFECAKVFCAFFLRNPRLFYLISKYRRRGGRVVKENYVGGKIACPVGAQYIAPV